MRVLLLPVMLGMCGLLSLLFGGPHSALLGRTAAEMGGHTVVLNDCHRAQMPGHMPAIEAESSEEGIESYRFAPCPGAEVLIEGEQLSVNGTFYGALNPESVVLVNQGEVVVNGVMREPLPLPQ